MGKIAIKNWFLFKNDLNWMRNYTLEIVKETEKAVLLRVNDKTLSFYNEQYWVPKSCLIEEWEKDTSGFAYHEYLENLYHAAYEQGIIENRTIKSGRNTYRGDAFIHKETTKGLQKCLEYYGIEYMDKKTWANS